MAGWGPPWDPLTHGLICLLPWWGPGVPEVVHRPVWPRAEGCGEPVPGETQSRGRPSPPCSPRTRLAVAAAERERPRATRQLASSSQGGVRDAPFSPVERGKRPLPANPRRRVSPCVSWVGERALRSGAGVELREAACLPAREPGASEARLFWRGTSRSGRKAGRTSAASAGWTCGPVCFTGATAEAEKPPFPIRVGNTQSCFQAVIFFFVCDSSGLGRVCFQGDYL